MLIPRNVLKAAVAHTDRENSRYALGAVLVERDESGKPIVVATDGRKLFSVTWDEDAAGDYPPVGDQTHVAGFSALIPVDAIKKIIGMAKVPTRMESSKPILRNVLLEEKTASASMVRFAATNIDTTERQEVKQADGRFPKWRDCIRVPIDRRSVGVDPRFISAMMDSFVALGIDHVDIVVGDCDKPIHFVGRSFSIAVDGVAMPKTADNDYGNGKFESPLNSGIMHTLCAEAEPFAVRWPNQLGWDVTMADGSVWQIANRTNGMGGIVVIDSEMTKHRAYDQSLPENGSAAIDLVRDALYLGLEFLNRKERKETKKTMEAAMESADEPKDEPEEQAWNPAAFIKIVADSPDRIRACDLDRLFTTCKPEHLKELDTFIREHNPNMSTHFSDALHMAYFEAFAAHDAAKAASEDATRIGPDPVEDPDDGGDCDESESSEDDTDVYHDEAMVDTLTHDAPDEVVSTEAYNLNVGTIRGGTGYYSWMNGMEAQIVGRNDDGTGTVLLPKLGYTAEKFDLSLIQ